MYPAREQETPLAHTARTRIHTHKLQHMPGSEPLRALCSAARSGTRSAGSEGKRGVGGKESIRFLTHGQTSPRPAPAAAGAARAGAAARPGRARGGGGSRRPRCSAPGGGGRRGSAERCPPVPPPRRYSLRRPTSAARARRWVVLSAVRAQEPQLPRGLGLLFPLGAAAAPRR